MGTKMKTYTKEELNTILEKHKAWVNRVTCGARAHLIGADLRGVDLSNADLRGADFRGSDLRGADLSNADLRGADFRYTILMYTDFSNADLSNAYLMYAYLMNADLSNAYLMNTCLMNADLMTANLSNACLMNADLSNTDLSNSKNVLVIPMTCPDSGSFIGWKKALSDLAPNRKVIVKLEIPEDAKRSSATGRKCRCDKAKVLEIQPLDENKKSDITEAYAQYDSNFKYIVGETVSVDDFEEDRFIECAPGIHFFINREEAVRY